MTLKIGSVQTTTDKLTYLILIDEQKRKRCSDHWQFKSNARELYQLLINFRRYDRQNQILSQEPLCSTAVFQAK